MRNNHIYFKNVFLNCSSALVGKKEFEGPLKESFDGFCEDEYFGLNSFEEAESEMVRQNLNILMKKNNINFEDIDIIFGGDLINQCTVTSYAVNGNNIPFIGLYGACSTAIESIICASVFINGDFANSAVGVTSSHFCSAERQYRFPLEYGSVRTPTSQNTVTGSGAFLITNKPSKIKIKSAVIGQIVDKNITDANNMGAAMAGAATKTITDFFSDENLSPEDFDIISTGDLGHEGNAIASELLTLEGFNMNTVFTDCGILIYDKNKQDTHAGGSGCGCVASVLAGHFCRLLNSGAIKNLLIVGTGALLNPNSVFGSKSIPAIAHAIHLSTED